jgi:hypothetical protein
MEPNPVQINEALQKKENTQIIAVEKITSELKQTQNADAQIERKPEILEKTTSKAQQDQNVAVQAEKKPEPIPVQAAAPIPASPVIPPRINKENESVKAREFIRFSNEIIEVINKCNTLQGRPFISDVESKALVKINKELTGLYVKAVQCENKPLTPQLKSNIESIKENLQAYQQQLTMIDRGHAYYADNKKRFELIINHMKDKCGNLLKSKNMNEELKRALEDVIFKLTALQLEKDSSYDTVGTFVQNNAGTIKSISNEIKRIEVECEKINPKESQTMTMRNK